MKNLCECGRPARAVSKFGKLRSKNAINGVPHSMKNHHLCYECWCKISDMNRARNMRHMKRRVGA